MLNKISVVVLFSLLTACGGGSSNNTPPVTYTISGTVTGITGSGLTLQNNGGDDLNISTDGIFSFSTALTDTSSYAVSVSTQPTSPNQTCTVSNASGSISGTDVTDVSVACVTNTYTISGTASGVSGSGLVLQNNAGDDLSIAADGSFSFVTALADTSSYAVTVSTQPSSPSQTCSVTNPSGTLSGADISNVTVVCATNTYSIGGTLTGLSAGSVELQNNGGDNLILSADGIFSFVTSLDDGSSFNVSVLSQPTLPNQTCNITNGSGNLTGSDITSVQINCSIDAFPDLFDEQVIYTNDIYLAPAPTGDDISGDGTIGAPYATLSKAAESAVPGTRINMAAGTYSTGNTISGLQGSIGTPIAIVANGNAIISGGMFLIQPRHLVLDGLTIQGGATRNALVIDDGGDYSNPNAAEYIIVKNSTLSSTDAGNYDAIQAAGIYFLYVVNNQISSVGDGSSAIQFVGCHNSVISQNTITNTGLGSFGVSTRGGSSDVIIHGNTFENMTASGAKAVQLGGYTSPVFFKPPLVAITTDPLAENFEAARITVLSNIINNVDTALVYDGCIDCVFANNTVTDPLAFIVRLLKSTVSDATITFADTQNGEFLNNIVIYSTVNIPSLNQVVNIGANTLPATFTFDHTLWWATNEAANYTTTLPAPIPPETASLYQLDPLFTTSVQIDSNSPVLGQGSESVTGAIGLDYGHAVYARPPAIGAYEAP